MTNFLEKHIAVIVFIAILLLAILMRFYQLGSNPPSLDWDEASLGYNAYSILETGADEYGNKLPLSFRSFDDYKPPLYVYLAVPSIALFGLNEFSVRLPSAIIGVLTVLTTYFLVKELLEGWNKREKEIIALISMFFVAVSPWSLQFSRAAFEGNIGLFFFSLGVLFLLKGINRKLFLIFSAASFVLSLYSYHSFRLVIPIFILFSIILFWKDLLKKKLYSAIFIIILIFLASPIFNSLLSAQGTGARLSMVTIFDSDILQKSIIQLGLDKSHSDYLGILFHNRRVVYGLAVIKGYFDHFNLDFLFLHGDGGRQHHAVDMGMLYLFDLPFILFGLRALLNKFSKRALLLLIWFLIAPIPSSITTGTPHPVRAIAMLIPLHIFSAIGIFAFLQFIRKYKNYYFRLLILFFTSSFFLFNFLYYIHQYYVHTPIEYGDFWQYGYKELFQETKKVENKYDKIIVTYKYDQPYIYYLFYNKVDPLWYQKHWDNGGTGKIERMVRDIGKYHFRNINWSLDKNLPNTLIIGSPDEITDDVNIFKEIKFPNGNTAFKFVRT